MANLITTAIAADMLDVTPQRVRQIATELKLKPQQQIGRNDIWSSADVKKMAARKTSKGPAKGKR